MKRQTVISDAMNNEIRSYLNTSEDVKERTKANTRVANKDNLTYHEMLDAVNEFYASTKEKCEDLKTNKEQHIQSTIESKNSKLKLRYNIVSVMQNIGYWIARCILGRYLICQRTFICVPPITDKGAQEDFMNKTRNYLTSVKERSSNARALYFVVSLMRTAVLIMALGAITITWSPFIIVDIALLLCVLMSYHNTGRKHVKVSELSSDDRSTLEAYTRQKIEVDIENMEKDLAWCERYLGDIDMELKESPELEQYTGKDCGILYECFNGLAYSVIKSTVSKVQKIENAKRKEQN